MMRSHGGDYEDGYNAGYADGLMAGADRLAALSSFEARTRAAEAALQGCGIGGIYADFGDLPDAIGQMATYIKEQDAKLKAAEQRAERLATAGRAFVEAWEKCHQLEKTGVAYRLMVDALADNEQEAEGK